MDDSQIHGSIEQLVAEEHELWGREAAVHATRLTVNGCNRSRSRSTNAGTCAPAPRATRSRAGPGRCGCQSSDVVEHYQQ